MTKNILAMLGALVVVAVAGGTVLLNKQQPGSAEATTPATSSFEEETKKYVEEVFAAIVPTWDEKAMTSRQTPYMQRLDVDGKNTAAMFSVIRNLGAFKENKGCRVLNVDTSFPQSEGNPPPVDVINYRCEAIFDKDTANVIFVLGKQKGVWGIAGFQVFSKYIDDYVKQLKTDTKKESAPIP